MAANAFVFCPNARCYATKDSPNGCAWRQVQHGPKNCTKCHFAFLLGRGEWKSARGGGSSGGKPNTTNQNAGNKRVTWGNVDDQSQPAARASVDKDEQITRRVLAKTLKDQGRTPEEVKAKLDEIFPPKPLSEEEKKKEVQERLEKAQRQHKHECFKHENMYAAAVKRAKELLEYRKSINVQRDKARLAKEHMERVQEEFDRTHAATPTAPTVQPARSIDGIFTKMLAQSKLLDKLDSEEARQLKDLCIQTHNQLMQDAAAPADAGSAVAASTAPGTASSAASSAAPAAVSGSAAAAGDMGAAGGVEEWVPGAVTQRQHPATILPALPTPPSLSDSMDTSRIKNVRLREVSTASDSVSISSNHPEEHERKRFMVPGDEDDLELPDDVVLDTATDWGISIADCRIYGVEQQQVQQQQVSNAGSSLGPTGGPSFP